MATHIAPNNMASGRPSDGLIAGLFKRVTSAARNARQDRIEKEFARQIKASGGRITDDLERQLDQIVRTHGGC